MFTFAFLMKYTYGNNIQYPLQTSCPVNLNKFEMLFLTWIFICSILCRYPVLINIQRGLQQLNSLFFNIYSTFYPKVFKLYNLKINTFYNNLPRVAPLSFIQSNPSFKWSILPAIDFIVSTQPPPWVISYQPMNTG